MRGRGTVDTDPDHVAARLSGGEVIRYERSTWRALRWWLGVAAFGLVLVGVGATSDGGGSSAVAIAGIAVIVLTVVLFVLVWPSGRYPVVLHPAGIEVHHGAGRSTRVAWQDVTIIDGYELGSQPPHTFVSGIELREGIRATPTRRDGRAVRTIRAPALDRAARARDGREPRGEVVAFSSSLRGIGQEEAERLLDAIRSRRRP